MEKEHVIVALNIVPAYNCAVKSLASNCGKLNGGMSMPDPASEPPNIISISFCI
jgi:hypothetical protein